MKEEKERLSLLSLCLVMNQQDSSKISFLQYEVVIRPYVYIDFSASDAAERNGYGKSERARGGGFNDKIIPKVQSRRCP